MAKPTPAPSPGNSTLMKGPPPEIVDTRTGEVLSLSTARQEGNDLMDAQAAAVLASGDLLAKLERALTAKKEDFATLEKDYWKPGAPGTKDAVLVGVYIGSAKIERLIQHAVAVKGAKGPYVVRLNGGHMLTGQLKQCPPGCIVRIEFLGQKISQGLTSASGQGNKFGEWVVTKIG